MASQAGVLLVVMTEGLRTPAQINCPTCILPSLLSNCPRDSNMIKRMKAIVRKDCRMRNPLILYIFFCTIPARICKG